MSLRKTSPQPNRSATLREVVGELLTAQVHALEARLPRGSWVAAIGAALNQHAPVERLRDVLDRDRALLVSQGPVPVTAAPPARKEVRAEPLASARPEAGPEEPIRTRTMARLLAAQGHRLRALAIVEWLISQGDADPQLQAEAELLRVAEAIPRCDGSGS